MSKVKSPPEKKRKSLLKDRRNVYGECPTSSRKNIRRGKQLSHKALRHAVSQELRSLEWTGSSVDGDSAEGRAREQLAKHKRASFKKMPDVPLAIVLDNKLRKRRLKQERYDEAISYVGVHLSMRAEQRLLRKIRRKK